MSVSRPNLSSRLLKTVRALNRSPLWLAGAYIVVASIWILTSDALVLHLTGSASAATTWQTVKGVLFVSLTGVLLYELIVLHDAALRREQEASEEQRRMASLGELSATIAHEFNNVLMISSSSLEVLARSIEPATPAYRAMLNIEEAQRRGTRLVNEILRFGRATEPVLKSTDLAACLRHFATQNAPLVAPARVSIDTPPQPVFAMADADLIQQALTNLVLNARDAASSRITLSVRNAGPEVFLTVDDDGSGIREADRPHIFEPMYTTKRNGTGLGLAIVYRIVTAHRGEIGVESREEGHGTRFRITLPSADAA